MPFPTLSTPLQLRFEPLPPYVFTTLLIPATNGQDIVRIVQPGDDSVHPQEDYFITSSEITTESVANSIPSYSVISGKYWVQGNNGSLGIANVDSNTVDHLKTITIAPPYTIWAAVRSPVATRAAVIFGGTTHAIYLTTEGSKVITSRLHIIGTANTQSIVLNELATEALIRIRTVGGKSYLATTNLAETEINHIGSLTVGYLLKFGSNVTNGHCALGPVYVGPDDYDIFDTAHIQNYVFRNWGVYLKDSIGLSEDVNLELHKFRMAGAGAFTPVQRLHEPPTQRGIRAISRAILVDRGQWGIRDRTANYKWDGVYPSWSTRPPPN